jgi:hypothetical protein
VKRHQTFPIPAVALLFCADANRAQTPPRAVKLLVHLLAASTSFRSSEGENEDVYPAFILVSGVRNESVLVRLAGTFPAYRKPISADMPQSTTDNTLRLRRELSCDRTFAEMPSARLRKILRQFSRNVSVFRCLHPGQWNESNLSRAVEQFATDGGE